MTPDFVSTIGLSDDERAVVADARRVAKEVLDANAEAYDRAAAFPEKNFAAMRERGFFGVTIPKSHNGRGLRAFAYSRFLKELAKGCAATAGSFHMHNTVMRYINILGTDDQKAFYFGEVLDHGCLFGSWGAEPTTSYAGEVAISTRYEETGDGYRINGKKYFCSLADGASYGQLFAVEQQKANSKSNLDDIQCFIIDARDPAVSIGSDWNPLGMRATVSNPISVEDYEAPEISKLGSPGDQLRFPLAEFFFLGDTTVYQGIAEGAYEWAVRYASTKKVGASKEPISQFDRIQRKIGEMSVAVRSGALAVDHAARIMDEVDANPELADERVHLSATLHAKALVIRVALQVTGLALEVAGGPGVFHGNPLERYHRDARTAVMMVPAYDQCIEGIAKLELGLGLGTKRIA
jgi:alkylation response protein AidB-like acyl-CoA dehydrogenase